MRSALKYIAAFLLAAALVVGALYQFFGLRLVVGGSGMPRLAFTRSNDTAAEVIARHREAQRTAAAGATKAATPGAPLTGAAASPAAGSAPGAPFAPTAAAYWTDFRGPLRDGKYDDVAIRTSWPAHGPAPLWKEPVGGGYASLVVAHGRAFTIEQRGRQEVVAAYEATTGRELWTNIWVAQFQEPMGGDGPRATPTWSDGLLYALGATGELRCLDDATGRLVWRKNILTDNDATNLQWGMAASPLIVGNTVIVLPGGRNGRSVVAYDRRTGERVWAALDDQAAYASPMLVTLAGTPQIVVVTAHRVVGLSPDSGKLLWEHPWWTNNEINCAQPLIIDERRLFLSSAYGVGAAVIEITNQAGTFSTREIWRNVRMKNKFTSSVLLDGFIYGLDESILACLDATTGAQLWKGGRYGYGQILLASGHIIVLTEDGDLALVRASPTGFDELARFGVLEGKTWNHPAMAGGLLFVRNLQEMAAFDLRLPR